MKRFGRSTPAVQDLDIPAKSALTWLYERRLVPYDWAKLLKAAEAKFTELKDSFPNDNQSKDVVLAGQYLKEHQSDYATACVVLEFLDKSKTEFSDKNFFGSYKHPVTKEWQMLIQIYEKCQLYWAE